MPPIRIELLGKLRFFVGPNPLTSIGTNRLQSLLGYLVLHGDAPQSREQLAFLLWPESSESQARTNLRQLLHHLRRASPVECSLLTADNQTVCWRTGNACSVDVTEFTAAAIRGADAHKRVDLTTAVQALDEAARLYQDDLLPDLYDQWLEPMRDQLRQQFADVLSRLSALLGQAGDYSAAIRHATRLVSLDPLRESSYQALMRLHAHNNDRSSALRVYHQCMRTLQRELGVSPSQATQDLFSRALKSEPPPPELRPHTAVASLPMVGRTSEWNRLLDCWRRASQGGIHLALILGEPGIGKSRLADELFQFCARSPESAASAYCYAGQGQLAYGPIAEWLRAEAMRSARAQLPKPQLAELTRVLPEILVENPEISAPQPLTESWQRRHLYEALHAAFRRDSKPLLLLIDDLQWCDHDSFEWLHSFFRSHLANGILVLATARMEETNRHHPLAGLVTSLRQSGQLSEFPLAPLTEQESAILAVQTTAHECAPSYLSELYRTTKGNPLFVVESARASQETAPGEAPPRVQAVIAARLAQLSPSAYELAGLAAAIGRPFSFDLLAKATDWDEDSLSRTLEELWRRRIIGGSASFDFTHNLLREVAYGELSPVRRRSLHRRVARALEELYASDVESVSGWLAVHYQAAGRAEEAIRSYRAAAEVAKRRFADTEAASLLRQALALCRDFPEELHFKKMCALVWCYNGLMEKANEILEPLRSLRHPAFEFFVPMPFPMLQSMFDGLYTPGLQWYWKADFVNELSDEAIALHIKHGSELPTLHSTMHIYPINGAAHKTGSHDTPWAYRHANWTEVIVGVDPDPSNKDHITAWAKRYWEALHPYGAGGAYVNFMMEGEGEDRIRATYGDNYARLARIKAKYDPENFFRVNQNIQPAA